MPVVVLLIEVAQVASGGPSRLLRIETLIHLGIAAQTEVPRGAGHELPQPHRMGMRARVVPESALHVGNEREILGNSFFLEDLSNALHVSTRALEAGLEALSRTTRELIDPRKHAAVDRDRKVDPLVERSDPRLCRGGRAVGDVRNRGFCDQAVDLIESGEIICRRSARGGSSGGFRIGRLTLVRLLRTAVRDSRRGRGGRSQSWRRGTADCEKKAGQQKMTPAHVRRR